MVTATQSQRRLTAEGDRRACGTARQLEPDRPTCFPPPDRRSVEGVAVRCTSSTRTATTSQPLSLLLIARLNSARSRTRRSICHFARVAQSERRFRPSFPLFQGQRRGGFAELVVSM
jgi:hypothetical protein